VVTAAGVLFDAVQSGTPDDRHWASAALSAATRAATGGRVRDVLLTRLEALGTNARKGLITVMAKSGADIGFSLPLLAKLACDTDSTVQHWSTSVMAEVIERHSELMARLTELLTDDDSDLSRGARQSLAVMGWKEMDLSAAVPALLAFTSQEGDAASGTALMSEALRSESAALVGRALQAANPKARLAAMLRLNGAAGRAPAALEASLVAFLEPMLRDKGKNIREEASLVLTTIAIKNGDVARVKTLMQHTNKEVRGRALLAMRKAAEAGLNVASLLPLLANELASSGDAYVRWTAASALEQAAKFGADLSVARTALEAGRSDPDGRTAAACAAALGG